MIDYYQKKYPTDPCNPCSNPKYANNNKVWKTNLMIYILISIKYLKNEKFIYFILSMVLITNSKNRKKKFFLNKMIYVICILNLSIYFF